MTRAILYYTCLTHPEEIEELCREQLMKAANGIPILSVSLNKAISFGMSSIVVKGERSPLTMMRQVLRGLELLKLDYVYLCESDVLYHPSHFEEQPRSEGTFCYNTNVWKQTYPDKHFIWTDDLQQQSGVSAYKDTLLDFYKQRVEQVEREGDNRHYEPGIRQTVGSQLVQNWQSEYPNICIRHTSNLTRTKGHPREFRNKRYAKGWKETDTIDGW